MVLLLRPCVAVLLAALTAPLTTQDAGEPAADTAIPPRDARSTAVYASYYERAESWPLKALVLLSLGPHWHPDGTPMLVDALTGKEDQLVPYALATLQRTRDDVLTAVANEDLIDALLDTAKIKHEAGREQALAILKRLAPAGTEIEERRDFERAWREMKRNDWAPAEWPRVPAKEGEQGGGTSTEPLLDRAIDLREAGLDFVIVIDSTGSMQVVIDQATAALDDIIQVFDALAPRFRTGLVHYKDLEDIGDGAKLLVPLTKGGQKVQKALSKLAASGGGDIPERVEKGLEVAYDRKTGWNPEANKLVLVVGDAPPHIETEGDLFEMVRGAHESPEDAMLGRRRAGPTTGEKDENTMRPFVTSAISANQQADRPFRSIAEAGGGSFAQIGPPRREKQDGPGLGGDAGLALAKDRRPAARVLAEHVLSDAFGPQWRPRIADFLEIWFAWREE